MQQAPFSYVQVRTLNVKWRFTPCVKSFMTQPLTLLFLVDASNAFNNINRQVTLLNILNLCPVIATVLINCYRGNAQLFVGGEVIFSKEGTTQGDPLAMVFFSLASVPLIRAVAVEATTQIWFADDAASGGRLNLLREWWDKLNPYGPIYGYFPKAVKTYLVVKPEKAADAERIFHDTCVNICETGKRYLGGTIGSALFQTEFVSNTIASWVKEVEGLTKVANTQPHAAYAALTHGLLGRWLYLIRVIDRSANSLLQPLEEAIRTKLIPTLTG